MGKPILIRDADGKFREVGLDATCAEVELKAANLDLSLGEILALMEHQVNELRHTNFENRKMIGHRLEKIRQLCGRVEEVVHNNAREEA